MSAQMYGKSGIINHSIGLTKRSLYVRNTILGLSNPSLRALTTFAMQCNPKKSLKLKDLYRQTVFNLNWEMTNLISNDPIISKITTELKIKNIALKLPTSRTGLDRVTKELKDKNIALRCGKNTYVVNIDFVCQLTLTQRERYIERITKYDQYNPVKLTTFKELSGYTFFELSGDPSQHVTPKPISSD